MKAEIIKSESTPPAFKPVTIALTFETQKELDTFGALFNYSPVCDLFRDSTWTGENTPDEIRKIIVQNKGCVITEYNRVKNALNYATDNH